MCQTTIKSRKAIIESLYETLKKELTIKGHPEIQRYKLIFNNRKRSLGTCNWKRKTIAISLQFLESAPMEEMIDTLKHEMAHALDAEERGFSQHDNRWKRWCLITGATPERVKALSREHMPKGKYNWICKNHGVIGTAHRKTKCEYRCKRCKEPITLELAK